MVIRRRWIKLSTWALCLTYFFLGPSTALAREKGRTTGHKTEVEVQLTESFYRALGAEEGKTYRTDKSEEYLRRIAVSTRYMVETNLKIMENQRRIIELLEAVPKTGVR